MLQSVAIAAAICAVSAAALLWPMGSAHAETLLTFRLPSEEGRTVAPNQPDIAESAPGTAPLLVFLPGTGSVPSSYMRFLDTAHAEGYSVLGLDYPDMGHSLARSCQGDMACYDDMLANRFNGADPTQFSAVHPSDAIADRLNDALGYLDAHDADGSWQRYRVGSRVRWTDLVLAGHSQGGSEAAYIAHVHKVRGVLMFSSPGEGLAGQTPTWTTRPSATPASREWALDDTHDAFAARIAPTWRALGIPSGAPARIPVGAHGLLTTLELGTPAEAHSRIIKDSTPLGTDHRPILEPVWQWMLRQPIDAGDASAARAGREQSDA